MNCSNSLQADVPGQYNIQLLCLITFPGTIKLPPSIAHVSEGKISFTFTTPTHLSCCLDCAFTAKENIYCTLKLKTNKQTNRTHQKNSALLIFYIKPNYSFESILHHSNTVLKGLIQFMILGNITNFRTTGPIQKFNVLCTYMKGP